MGLGWDIPLGQIATEWVGVIGQSRSHKDPQAIGTATGSGRGWGGDGWGNPADRESPKQDSRCP